jgi:hypothetical protein
MSLALDGWLNDTRHYPIGALQCRESSYPLDQPQHPQSNSATDRMGRPAKELNGYPLR